MYSIDQADEAAAFFKIVNEISNPAAVPGRHYLHVIIEGVDDLAVMARNTSSPALHARCVAVLGRWPRLNAYLSGGDVCTETCAAMPQAPKARLL